MQMEEIINSIMQSPENTNPNVLRGQLQGIMGAGDSVLIVHASTDSSHTQTLDKTWKEIHDAPFAVLKIENELSGFDFLLLRSVNSDKGVYSADFVLPGSAGRRYTTDGENGYPSYHIR